MKDRIVLAIGAFLAVIAACLGHMLLLGGLSIGFVIAMVLAVPVGLAIGRIYGGRPSE